MLLFFIKKAVTGSFFLFFSFFSSVLFCRFQILPLCVYPISTVVRCFLLFSLLLILFKAYSISFTHSRRVFLLGNEMPSSPAATEIISKMDFGCRGVYHLWINLRIWLVNFGYYASLDLNKIGRYLEPHWLIVHIEWWTANFENSFFMYFSKKTILLIYSALRYTFTWCSKTVDKKRRWRIVCACRQYLGNGFYFVLLCQGAEKFAKKRKIFPT